MKLKAYSSLEREEGTVIEIPFCGPKFFQCFPFLCNGMLYLIFCLFMLLHFFHWYSFPCMSSIEFYILHYFSGWTAGFFNLTLPPSCVSNNINHVSLGYSYSWFYFGFCVKKTCQLVKHFIDGACFLLQEYFLCPMVRHFVPGDMMLPPTLMRFCAESTPFKGSLGRLIPSL